MKYNKYFIVGIGYMSILLGMTIMSVGKIPVCSTEPYPWTLIPSMLGVMLIPFVAGLLSNN